MIPPVVGFLKTGWFAVRALYVPAHLAVAFFAFQQLYTLRWLGVGFVGFAFLFARQIWLVARSREPRFEVTESGVRCDFAALGTLTRVDQESVVKVTVLSFRGSIVLRRSSGRPMVIPWRWVRLENDFPLEVFATWLGSRMDVPVSQIRGPFEGVGKERPLLLDRRFIDPHNGEPCG